MSEIFLSYASKDVERIQPIVSALERKGWNVWWDRKIPPGRTFDDVIEEAIDQSSCMIVVWSKNSVVSKWVRTEAGEGDRRGNLIPILIDNVEIPLAFRRMEAAQLVDWDGISNHPELDNMIEAVANHVQPSMFQAKKIHSPGVSEQITKQPLDTEEVVEEKKHPAKEILSSLVNTLLTEGNGRVDVGGSILQIIFFSLAALDALGSSNDTVEILMGITAILAGIVFLIKKQIPATIGFKISAILFLLVIGLGYRLDDLIPFAEYLAGITALITAAILVLTVRIPKKPVLYSSISFATFLFLVGIYVIATNFENYPAVISNIDTLILITSITTSILLLRDL